MKVVVTGANGMIGSSVVSSPAAPPWVSSLGLQVGPGGGEPDLERPVREAHAVVACDITDRAALRPLVSGARAVVHLAGPPSVAASFAEPDEFLRAHVLGTAAVVDLCQELGVPRLVYVSSAEVYGRPSVNPVGELEPFSPRSPYGAAKVGAESIVGAATRSGRLDAVILRPFSVYGPGARRDGLLGSILEQTMLGSSVRLRKVDGVRDYCFVRDVAEAVWRAADVDLIGLRTFNIASGRGTRTDELAMACLEARHGQVPEGATVEALPAAEGDRPSSADIPELVADVSRARDELGWQAATSLVDGLASTIDWFAGSFVGQGANR